MFFIYTANIKDKYDYSNTLLDGRLKKGVNLPLATKEVETKSGLDKVPVAALTNTF